MWGYLSIKNIDEIIFSSQNDIKRLIKNILIINSIITLLPDESISSQSTNYWSMMDYLDVNRRS